MSLLDSVSSVLIFFAIHGSHVASAPAYPYPPEVAPVVRHHQVAALPKVPLPRPRPLIAAMPPVLAPALVLAPVFAPEPTEPALKGVCKTSWCGKYALPPKWVQLWAYVS